MTNTALIGSTAHARPARSRAAGAGGADRPKSVRTKETNHVPTPAPVPARERIRP